MWLTGKWLEYYWPPVERSSSQWSVELAFLYQITMSTNLFSVRKIWNIIRLNDGLPGRLSPTHMVQPRGVQKFLFITACLETRTVLSVFYSEREYYFGFTSFLLLIVDFTLMRNVCTISVSIILNYAKQAKKINILCSILSLNAI